MDLQYLTFITYECPTALVSAYKEGEQLVSWERYKWAKHTLQLMQPLWVYLENEGTKGWCYYTVSCIVAPSFSKIWRYIQYSFIAPHFPKYGAIYSSPLVRLIFQNMALYTVVLIVLPHFPKYGAIYSSPLLPSFSKIWCYIQYSFSAPHFPKYGAIYSSPLVPSFSKIWCYIQ